MIVYAVIAYGLVYLFQLVKPTTPEEIEEGVRTPRRMDAQNIQNQPASDGNGFWFFLGMVLLVGFLPFYCFTEVRLFLE